MSPFDEQARAAFLARMGCKIVESVGQDSSNRRYFRVEKNDHSLILMESVPDTSPQVLRGHKMADFVRIADWLRAAGLSAPDIIEVDLAGGYMLLEDFGDASFKRALGEGMSSETLYTLAADVLDHLCAQKNPPDLPLYYESHVHANHRYIMEYYVPDAKGHIQNYLAIWQEIEKSLPPCPQGFVHVDFHAENLMFLPARSGLKRCGILDFQGAMIGPIPYDQVNLLEDARVDVPLDIRMRILSRYDATFRAWYRVLGTQFHSRVLGQFIRMAVVNGDARYLCHVPRLENYIREGLQDPLLRPLKSFFDDLKVDFSSAARLNGSILNTM